MCCNLGAGTEDAHHWRVSICELKLLACLFLMPHFYLSCNMNLDAKGTVNCLFLFVCLFVYLMCTSMYTERMTVPRVQCPQMQEEPIVTLHHLVVADIRA